MAFFTRPELDNRQFKQVSGSTLTLSGNTEIVSGGTFTLQGKEIVATGGTYGQVLTLDFDGKIKLLDPTGSGGTGVYMLESPPTVTVGGITPAYTLTGKTLDVILRDMLVVYQAPAFSSFSVTGQQTLVEAGTILSGSRTFTWGTSNSGNVQVNSIDVRDVNTNTLIITNTANDGSQSATINTITLTNDGNTQAWRGEGTNTQLNNFQSSNFTVTARYLRFFGASATTPANSAAVRALPTNAFQTAAANTFILNTGNALTKFCVALPPGRVITSVIDLDALNANITGNYVFVGTRTVLDGGGSGTARTYNLYEMNVGVPYSTSHQHQITTA